jgi:TRAP transporter TAXI family solute receptor
MRRTRPLAAWLGAALLLAACGTGGRAGGSQQLSVATGAKGGVYFVYGGGLGELISSTLRGYRATSTVTTGSVANMTLIADGKADLAFTLADTAGDAVQGKGSFHRAVPALALARLYVNYTQVVTTADKGLHSIEDLRGKRVSTGAHPSGTEVIARRILTAAGLDPATDIKPRQLGVAESVQAIEHGSLDAFFWSGGLPTAAVADLAAHRRLVLLPTAEYVEPLQQQYGQVYTTAPIRKDAYKGLSGDVATIGVANYLVVNRSMSDELAYELTRLLFQEKSELVKVHPEAKSLDVATAQEVAPLELHPGAQRYYQEAR